MAGGFVFFATGSRLLKLDASTGAVVAEAPLADGTAYGCRPIYAKGLVVVPLNNGALAGAFGPHVADAVAHRGAAGGGAGGGLGVWRRGCIDRL